MPIGLVVGIIYAVILVTIAGLFIQFPIPMLMAVGSLAIAARILHKDKSRNEAALATAQTDELPIWGSHL